MVVVPLPSYSIFKGTVCSTGTGGGGGDELDELLDSGGEEELVDDSNEACGVSDAPPDAALSPPSKAMIATITAATVPNDPTAVHTTVQLRPMLLGSSTIPSLVIVAGGET